MSEGGYLPWKRQNVVAPPSANYASLQKPMKLPEGKAWHLDPQTKEWKVIELENNKNTTVGVPLENLVHPSLHVVQESDTMQGICLKYKIRPVELRRTNRFSGSNLLLAPSTLVVPTESGNPTSPKPLTLSPQHHRRQPVDMNMTETDTTNDVGAGQESVASTRVKAPCHMSEGGTTTCTGSGSGTLKQSDSVEDHFHGARIENNDDDDDDDDAVRRNGDDLGSVESEIDNSSHSDSFHSLHEHEHEHEQNYLLSEDRISDASLSTGNENGNENYNDNGTTSSTQQDDALEKDNGDGDGDDDDDCDNLNEENELLLEKQSFQEDGRVTLCSSRTRNIHIHSKSKSLSRRFKQSGYQCFDTHDGTGTTIRIPESEELYSQSQRQSKQQWDEVQVQVPSNIINRSRRHSDHSDAVISELNGNSSIGSASESVSGSNSDRTPVISSPSNELRQRVGTGTGQSPDSDSSRAIRTSIGNIISSGSNRIRSYTSPDTRSIRNASRYAEVRSRYQSTSSTRGEQRPLLNSLDAGMTVLKRWMTTHSPGQGSHPRPSRAARVVQMQNDFDSNVDSELSLSLGEEDYFALSSAGDRRQIYISSRSNHGTGIGGSGSVSVNSSVGSGERINTGTHQHHSTFIAPRIYYPQTIQEEGDNTPIRQRANSEPERTRVRRWMGIDFPRRRQEEAAAAAASNFNQPVSRNRTRSRRRRAIDIASVESLESGGNSLSYDHVFNMDTSTNDHDRPNRVSFDIESMAGHGNGNGNRIQNDNPTREARRNWVMLNRRFQLIVVLVGLICSFLLFTILLTWVVLTSAYVVSIDSDCDLPLKPYFWLATVQLILDVFRKEIMKFVLRFDPNSARQHIPTRVIVYNLIYLIYAMIVLRIGIASVFLTHESSCPKTATTLFNTTRVFVTISVIAWLLILFGYLIPFCIVAIMLTRNGYSPGGEDNQQGLNFGVFPDTTNGAPSNCIRLLKTICSKDLGEEHPKECCICMADFTSNETIVVTECDHVFHQRCCEEWLKQARTCPVCRTDIPESLGMVEDEEDDSTDPSLLEDGILFSRVGFRASAFHRDLVNLMSLIREANTSRH